MSEDKNNEDTANTHFGYQQVPLTEKSAKVADVFHSVADKYDIMNDLMSFGIHRLWKHFAIETSGVRVGQRVLDVAGGTGDLTKKYAKKVGASGEVVLTDINASMLKRGRNRLIDDGFAGNIKYVQADAECLPFEDNYFDCICIAFGLRNVSRIDVALESMYRVLKPGACLVVLEFSKPTLAPLSAIYDLYSFKILPVIGKWVANDADSYKYLAESIRMHPDQKTLLNKMREAGYDSCEYHNLSGGVVALHKGYKF